MESVKTVRFTKIVDEVGTPEPYTLWLPPEKDPHLQAAIKAHRVMTLHQENTGHASDFGEVGFVKEVQGSFLLFPKSLKRYEGQRVVGVKYGLLKETPAEPPAPKPRKSREREADAKEAADKPEPQPEKPAREKPAPSPPAPTKFEPLRVFEPEGAQAQPKSSQSAPPTTTPDESQQLKSLTREVRRAMKKLEGGNAVAAYQILQKSISRK